MMLSIINGIIIYFFFFLMIDATRKSVKQQKKIIKMIIARLIRGVFIIYNYYNINNMDVRLNSNSKLAALYLLAVMNRDDRPERRKRK